MYFIKISSKQTLENITILARGIWLELDFFLVFLNFLFQEYVEWNVTYEYNNIILLSK